MKKENPRIQFGQYTWQILETKGDKMLILSERVLEKRACNDKMAKSTWETCNLRAYLNNEFFNYFSAKEKTKIATTNIQTSDNPWFGTIGGEDTTDKIFLLSIEEVVKNFGDSGQLKNKNPNSKYFINDQYKTARKAPDLAGNSAWWWLRSPGLKPNVAAQVYNGGALHMSGHYVNNPSGGVRPALWLAI